MRASTPYEASCLPVEGILGASPPIWRPSCGAILGASSPAESRRYCWPGVTSAIQASATASSDAPDT
jgi:hypothetical protein